MTSFSTIIFQVDLDTDTQEFVFNWLKNNLMISGLKLSSSDDPEFNALEEKLVQVESEKDNLILEVKNDIKRIRMQIWIEIWYGRGSPLWEAILTHIFNTQIDFTGGRAPNSKKQKLEFNCDEGFNKIWFFQVGVLHEQTERQCHRIADLEKMLAAKKDMLRHTEQVNATENAILV